MKKKRKYIYLEKCLIIRILQIYIFSFYDFLFFISLSDAEPAEHLVRDNDIGVIGRRGHVVFRTPAPYQRAKKQGKQQQIFHGETGYPQNGNGGRTGLQ